MNQVMQWNLSIDFNKKNNPKPSYAHRGTTHPSRRPAARWATKSSQLSSEAFLRHTKPTESTLALDDPRKLIKKGEIPVRIGSLLGLEQVGQCIFVEYDKDIILIDAGMEFAAEAELWADYIIPDISYIKKNKAKLKWIVLTHGHLDHIWALRDILHELDFPIIYTTPLTLGIVKKTFDDPKEAQKIKYKIIDPDVDLLKIGCFSLEFVRVNHNIPETLALSIQTPKWVIFNSADFKIDHTPAIDKPADLAKIARIGTEGVKLYIGDSLGADRPGRSISEKVIGKHLDDLIKNTKTRMIIATFASNIWRIIQIINSAIKYNKVIFLSGRSMVNNVEICQQLGYINVPAGYIRKLSNEIDTLPDERVLILSTWAQGEEFAGLTRMAKGEHNILQLRKDDTILMSSSTIPGNESAVNHMINDLVVKDVNLVTNDEIDIHASWHGYMEDHKLFLSLLNPEFFLPFFMPPSERYAHKKIALDMGMANERILMPNQNGNIVEMYDKVVLVSHEKLKLDKILVDGKGKGHLSGEYVIKARGIMAGSGVISLIFKIDTKTRELIGNIQIESRGFVYSSEVRSIHTQIVDFARAKYNENIKRRMDIKDNLRIIKDDLGEHITKIIWRVPMIMPMYVYINRDPHTWTDLPQEESIVGMTLDEQGYDD
jgi:ribonuclease J